MSPKTSVTAKFESYPPVVHWRWKDRRFKSVEPQYYCALKTAGNRMEARKYLDRKKIPGVNLLDLSHIPTRFYSASAVPPQSAVLAIVLLLVAVLPAYHHDLLSFVLALELFKNRLF